MELALPPGRGRSPYVKNIRDHVINGITPIVEVDGRDKMVDLYSGAWGAPGSGPAEPFVLGKLRSRTTTTATRWA